MPDNLTNLNMSKPLGITSGAITDTCFGATALTVVAGNNVLNDSYILNDDNILWICLCNRTRERDILQLLIIVTLEIDRKFNWFEYDQIDLYTYEYWINNCSSFFGAT